MEGGVADVVLGPFAQLGLPGRLELDFQGKGKRHDVKQGLPVRVWQREWRDGWLPGRGLEMVQDRLARRGGERFGMWPRS